MVIQPSSSEFSNIENKIREANPRETDLGIVYTLYNDTLRLPQRPYHILSQEFRLRENQHSRYLGTSERWDPREIIRETKLVHFSDHPIPEPWIAPKTTWEKYAPRCIAMSYRRFNCGNRDAWVRFYTEYRNRRKNVCGAGF
jgi:hypothetical protein